MTFTFVVEDGSGISDANSYVTTEYADDYIAANPFASEEWLALDDDAKEKLLVRSTGYLDSITLWHGHRVDDESGLRWPRWGAIDEDGFEIANDSIPSILQNAVCEFAQYLMSTDWTAPQATRGMTLLEVDSVKMEWTKNWVRPSVPPVIVMMLSPIGVVNKGIRPAFKKIVR